MRNWKQKFGHCAKLPNPLTSSTSFTAFRRRIHYSSDVHFNTHKEKEAFLLRLKSCASTCRLLGVFQWITTGCWVLCAMSASQSLQTDERIGAKQRWYVWAQYNVVIVQKNNLCRHGYVGVYVDDDEDQACFVTERCCFRDLMEVLCSPCPRGITVKPRILDSVILATIMHFCLPSLR